MAEEKKKKAWKLRGLKIDFPGSKKRKVRKLFREYVADQTSRQERWDYEQEKKKQDKKRREKARRDRRKKRRILQKRYIKACRLELCKKVSR